MSSKPLLWSFVQQIGRQLASYGIFLLLAQLLPPRDFGIVGIATAWLAFMAVFSELGFSVALIQKSDITSAHFSSTFYLNLVMGAVLTLAGVALAVPVSGALDIPDSAAVIMALSIGFLVNAFSLTQTAVAQKAMRFKDLAKRDILANLGGGAVGVLMAWRGFGIWSLVAQNLIGSLLSAALLWGFSDFRPRLREVSRERIKELWGYSSSMFQYNFFKFLVQNADRLLVGFFLGPEAVGLYTFANKIILMPAAAVRGAMGAYFFPFFAALQKETTRVTKAYMDINKTMGLVPVPALLSFAALAPSVIPSLFGGKWNAAIPLIQIFTLVGAIQFMLAPTGELMKALGKPRWLLMWSVGFSAVTMVLLTLGCQWNVTAVGAAFALAHALVLPVNFILAARLVPIGLKECLAALWHLPAYAAPVVVYIASLHAGREPLSDPWAGPALFALMALAASGIAFYQRSFLTRQLRGKNAISPAATAVPAR